VRCIFLDTLRAFFKSWNLLLDRTCYLLSGGDVKTGEMQRAGNDFFSQLATDGRLPAGPAPSGPGLHRFHSFRAGKPGSEAARRAACIISILRMIRCLYPESHRDQKSISFDTFSILGRSSGNSWVTVVQTISKLTLK
jgi:hypothetical protein